MGYQGIFQKTGQTKHAAQKGSLLGSEKEGADDDWHMEHGGLNDGQVDHADGGEGEQKENGGKHGQDSQALHLPVLLGAGGVGVHIQLPPGCRSRRAGYSAYLDAATGRDGPAVSLRGVQRPATRDSRGHYNGYILRLQSHCGKPAAVLV